MQPSKLVRVAATVVAFAGSAIPAMAEPVPECILSQEALRDALDQSDQQLTRDVALRMADVQESCEVPMRASPAKALMAAPTLLAESCASDPVLAKHSDRAWLRGDSLAATVVHDWDDDQDIPADASYTRSTRIVRYATTGEVYAFTAHSHGGGTISVYGVTLTATSAQAQAGCMAPGEPLCWAKGYAEATVPVDNGLLLQVSAYGGFNEC